ncbi:MULTISPECIES: TetR/AcrR family transcriptional regulator [Niastella]|uniref:TetR/AcrR family transcriptional regulator n=1 Tax=Niastella soli TaxID=2821487 RepID=A0ABS3Z283_9BACT|nr:TetR/AcrR family transcriptional regulator [Niastella soli]MBO9204133.1 TetR/AcrR family transcriptional regulator [Niastella soli]
MPKTKQFDETEVLIRARELFCKKGYNGTSMDDLVQATGISRSSIYDTFGDKHGLFLKSLDQYRNEQQCTMEQQTAKSDSPKKKIRAIFEYFINDILADKDGKGCLLINVSLELGSVDNEVATIFHANMDDMEQLLASLIKEGQAKGEIPKKFTPKAMARHFYNSLMGLRVTGTNKPDGELLREIVKLTLSILDE